MATSRRVGSAGLRRVGDRLATRAASSRPFASVQPATSLTPSRAPDRLFSSAVARLASAGDPLSRTLLSLDPDSSVSPAFDTNPVSRRLAARTEPQHGLQDLVDPFQNIFAEDEAESAPRTVPPAPSAFPSRQFPQVSGSAVGQEITSSGPQSRTEDWQAVTRAAGIDYTPAPRTPHLSLPSPSPVSPSHAHTQSHRSAALPVSSPSAIPPPPNPLVPSPTSMPSPIPPPPNSLVPAPTSTPSTLSAYLPEPDLLSRTFYRRELPSNLVSFTSEKGKRLFRESLLAGRAESYFSLVGNFTSQSHPTFCGLGSLAMVLNALEVDPKKRWKGVWRWWSDELLNLCTPLVEIQRRGVTFRDFECLARNNGLSVTAKRGDEVSYAEFLRDIEISSTSEDVHMVVSFSRKTLLQTGDGHFSPVCAYHKAENKVLVLDVARFKYPSYFASVQELYEAMKPVDKETGLPRGYFLLRRGDRKPVPLCKVALSNQTPADLQTLFSSTLPTYLASLNVTTLEDVVRAVLSAIPDDYRFLVALQSAPQDLAGKDEQKAGMVERHRRRVEELVAEAKRNGLYRVVENVAGGACAATETRTLREGAHAAHDAATPLPPPVASCATPTAEPTTVCCSWCVDISGGGVMSDQEARDRKVALATIFMLASPDIYQGVPKHLLDSLKQFRKAVEPDSTKKEDRLLREEVARVKVQIAALMNEGCTCRQQDAQRVRVEAQKA